MDDPAPPRLLRLPPAPDQSEPDGLLRELHEVHIALAIAEHHIRAWRASRASGDMSRRPRLSYAAHEALHEAGEAINRIAELLKVQVNGTRATQQGHSTELSTEASPNDAARR